MHVIHQPLSHALLVAGELWVRTDAWDAQAFEQLVLESLSMRTAVLSGCVAICGHRLIPF
jgi:hypothetical protein